MTTKNDLLQKYKLFQDLMDHIPDVIYFKDKKGRLLMVNQAHAKGLGLKPEEVIGKSDFDFFPKERAETMFKDDQSVMTSGKPIIDKIERATRADGVDNYVSTTKIPRYDNNGNIIGLIGITRDITHRVQIETLRKEKEIISKKLEALEELNRTKSEFVSVVSHELRTPLTVIRESVSLIYETLAGPINDQQKKYLKLSLINIARLKKIIDDLLETSRIEGGKIKLHYSLVNLNDLLLDNAEFYKKQAQDKGISLEYNLPREQINIFLDAERINQVISNLIDNALKFTETNGKITVEARSVENGVRVGVLDTGIGMSKKDLPTVFNKFVQAVKDESAKRKGVGLGLAIAKDLVALHGGNIWAESKLGMGSKFYFNLPFYYSLSMMDTVVRDKINEMLSSGIKLYFVNILIVNFNEFRKRNKIHTKELFLSLDKIINRIFIHVNKHKKEPIQVAIKNKKIGEYGIIFPEATEVEASTLCETLKDNIREYFYSLKVKNVFINFGILSYPSKKPLKSSQQFNAELFIKKIYIGSEVRRHKRVNCVLNVELFTPDKKTTEAQTIDISQSGMCLLSDKHIDTNSATNVVFTLPKTQTPLNLKSRIVWIKNWVDLSSGEKKYKMGLEFINPKPEYAKTISRFIKSASKN
jgi:PAS domain S-box-containing protein